MERWHSSVMMKSKVSMGIAGLYSRGSGCLNEPLELVDRFVLRDLRQVLALQHGVHALDGADADAGGGVERVAGQALDDVFLGELEVVVGRDVLLEFLERLVAEVAAVDQEQHAPRAGELDQAVDEGNRGEGLARAGGHLDQGARAVFPQGVFEVVDGRDLRGPEAFLDQLWHVAAGGRGRCGANARSGGELPARRFAHGCRR